MKIGIVGLGLIGGSIYKKLTELKFDIVGISNSQNGTNPNIINDYSNLKDCNIIFVATPMEKTLETLDKLENIINKETIVTDVCSVKEFVSKKDFSYIFIPSHPMAGTEKQGFENSFSNLFEGTKWVITPKNENGIKELTEIINKLGAEVIKTTPEAHDKAVAMISHMPMIVAQGLMELVKNNKLSMQLASSGFRDMTRLALSNTKMAESMINLNSKNVETALLQLYSAIGDLIKENYPSKIEYLKKIREKMYKDGKNNLKGQ